MNFKKKAKGFSIIELLIVVAIITILLLIALPQYQSYVIRAQIAEAMTLAEAPKKELGQIAAVEGSFSETVTTVATGSGKYVKTGSVLVGDNPFSVTIQYVFGNEANSNITDEIFVVSGTIQGKQVVWSCGAGENSENVKSGLPASC